MWGKVHSSAVCYPYISRSYGGRPWNTVCFDNMREQVSNSFKRIDLEGLAFTLIAWSKYYHYSKTNPHNRIDQSLLGYPKTIGDLYPLLAPGDGWPCFERINLHKQLTWDRNNYKDMTIPDAISQNKHCDDIECLFRGKCEAYKAMHRVITEEIKPLTKEELDMQLASFSR